MTIRVDDHRTGSSAPSGSATTIPVIDPVVVLPKQAAGMTRRDWIVSVYAGAATSIGAFIGRPVPAWFALW